MVRTRWTSEQDDILRSKYKTIPARQLAVELGLKEGAKEGAIYARACRLGLTEEQSRRVTRQELQTKIEELHPQGYSDAEIADLMKVDRHRVGEARNALGLVHNGLSDRHRKRIADKTREQLKKTGYDSLSHYRLALWSQWKRSFGWPEELSLRAVQALEVFYRLQVPLSRIQLCQAMGVSWKKKTAPLSNKKGGTVLAELASAGFVSQLPKAFQGRSLYFLNPGVKPSDSRSEPTFPNSDGPICDSAGVVVALPSRPSDVAANPSRRVGQLNRS